MQRIKDWLNSDDTKWLRNLPLYKIVEENFYRESIPPIWMNDELLRSPAYGILLYVKRLNTIDDILEIHGKGFKARDLIREDMTGEFISFGIFMTFYDIHTNYMPTSGILRYKRCPKLKIENVSMTKVELELLDGVRPSENNMDYLFYNERVVNTIYNKNQTYYVVQIADLETGAIVPLKDYDDVYGYQGEPFSLIRFGSQVDVIVPVNDDKQYNILVEDKIGWHIDAVTDPLLKISDIGSDTM